MKNDYVIIKISKKEIENIIQNKVIEYFNDRGSLAYIMERVEDRLKYWKNKYKLKELISLLSKSEGKEE